jgi:hypothetical protein
MADNGKIGALDPKDFYVEAGNSGLKVFGGYVVEDYDPALRGMRGARLLREMTDTDSTVGAIIFVITQVIRKIQWHVAPADQSAAAEIAAEFFESVMTDMSHTWSDFVCEVVSMFTYGYAPFEIVLKERKGKNQQDNRLSSKFNDGMIGVRKLAIRGQDTILRWIMDADNNDVLGMVQIPWTGGIRTIPIEKLMIFRTQSYKGNPEGRSLLRNAFRPYYFRKRLEELEAIGVERDMAGLPVMSIPAEVIAAGSSGNDPQAAATLNAYKNLTVNIRRNSQEGLVIPSNTDDHGKPMFELKLLSSGGSRQFDTSKIIDRYTQAIATTVMADFLLLGHGSRSGGGAALGTSKIDMFFAALETMVQVMIDTLNAELVPLLSDLNGIPEKLRPQFFTDKAEQVDLGRLGAYINALAASGMPLFPDPELEAYLRSVAGLPEPSDDVAAMNDQNMALDHQVAVNQKVQQLQPPPPPAVPGAPGAPGKPPATAGAGGGNPAAPQGQYGAPRAGPVVSGPPRPPSQSEPAV